jgi:predicted amidophosphoribosyltransferase
MNVRDAFGLTRGDARARSPTGRWILLVDDVVTTGSTLASCAEALLAAGAVAVSAITVARER